MRYVVNMIGTFIADGAGNITGGARTLNIGGGVDADTIDGVYTVMGDGTFTLALNGYQNEEHVAIEEFACVVPADGRMYNCIITRIARVDLAAEPVESPVVGTAEGKRME